MGWEENEKKGRFLKKGNCIVFIVDGVFYFFLRRGWRGGELMWLVYAKHLPWMECMGMLEIGLWGSVCLFCSCYTFKVKEVMPWIL